MKSLYLIYFCCGETLKPLYHQIAGGRCDYFTPGGILHTTSVDDKCHSWQSSVHSVKALTAWPIVVKSDTSGIPWSTKLCLGFLGPASKYTVVYKALFGISRPRKQVHTVVYKYLFGISRPRKQVYRGLQRSVWDF